MRRLSVPSILTLAAIGGLLAVSCVPSAPLGPVASSAPACRVTHVVDGDTVDMTCGGSGPFRARLMGFDTAESWNAGCPQEAALAEEATARLRAMVRQARSVEARLGGTDRYDRRLVALSLDGRDVGDTLIAEGLAVRYTGGRRIDWCARLT